MDDICFSLVKMPSKPLMPLGFSAAELAVFYVLATIQHEEPLPVEFSRIQLNTEMDTRFIRRALRKLIASGLVRSFVPVPVS